MAMNTAEDWSMFGGPPHGSRQVGVDPTMFAGTPPGSMPAPIRTQTTPQGGVDPAMFAGTPPGSTVSAPTGAQSAPAVEDWSMFNGTPPGSTLAAPTGTQSAPAPQDWSMFGGPPVSGPPDASAARTEVVKPNIVRPQAFPDGGGVLPDGSATRDPAVWKRWVKEYEASSAATSTAQKTGPGANAAAGLVEGGSDVLNTLADPFGNLIGKPAVMLGTTVHDMLAPVFGYTKFSVEQRAALLGDQQPQPGTAIASAIGRDMGAPSVDQVVPDGTGEALLRAGVRAGVGMAGLNAASPAQALPGAIGGGLAAGAAGGITAEVASQIADDEYKPLAGMVGNMLGAGVPMAAGSALRSGSNALMAYGAPAIGRRNVLSDLAGQALVGSDGAALMASRNQLRMAGNDLQAAASDPAAVRATLDAQPAPIVPGAQPTTAQLTRDPGLAMREYAASRSGTDLQKAAFRGRADAQNDARVNVLQGVANGADPGALPAALQQQAADLDASGSARVQQVQQQTAQQVAQAQAMLDQRTAGLRAQAAQSADAMGGNLPPGSEAQVGAALRDPIAANLKATRTRESALWDAIDPEGTLAVDMRPVRDRANEIARSIGPNAAPLAGDEAAIMQTATGLPNVQSFRDLADLRTRLTDTLRAARIDPTRAPEVRRLSVLLDGVHDAMAGRVTSQAASDAHAVQTGTMAPESAIGATIQQWVDNYQQRRAAADGTTGGYSGQGPVGVSGGGQEASASLPGAAGDRSFGSGSPSGNPGLQGQAPLTANFDQAAAQRYTDARAATAQRAATFKNAPGVGQALQSGPTSGTFRAPDTAVSNMIVKAGPAGAETARSYLAAGGTPEALSDAAAFSLRREAMRADGTLDPVKYAGWAKQRASFLSQIPDAAARFGDAVEAQKAADVGSETATQMLKEATKAAQRTVDDAVAARAAAHKQMQDSAAGKFLGSADPVASVGSILRNKATGRTQMAQLAQAVKGNADATAGLQRAVAEHIQRDLIGNTKGVASESGYIRNDRFQTFLRQAEPALREVMTPEQMTALKHVSASLEQSNLSSQVGVGSPTAQLTAGRGETLLARVGREIAGPVTGGSMGAAVGSAFGPIGATTGSLLGGAIGKAVQAAREAGVQNVEHLKVEALLNPALFRLLMTKVTPENGASLASQLASQLRRVSLVGGVQASAGQEDRRQQRNAPAVRPYAMKPNALMDLGSSASLSAQPSSNALSGALSTEQLMRANQPRRNALSPH